MICGDSDEEWITDNVGWDHLMCYTCKLHEEATRLPANPRAFVPELDLPSSWNSPTLATYHL